MDDIKSVGMTKYIPAIGKHQRKIGDASIAYFIPTIDRMVAFCEMKEMIGVVGIDGKKVLDDILCMNADTGWVRIYGVG